MVWTGFDVGFSTVKDARAALAALALETNRPHEKRSRTRMDLEKKVLHVTIVANGRKAGEASKYTYGKLLSFLAGLQSI